VDSAYDQARLEYRWTFDDGYTQWWETNPILNRSFTEPGTVNLTLYVRDEAGEEDWLDVELEIIVPSPAFTSTLQDTVEMDDWVGPQITEIPLGYDGEMIEYTVDWGDGDIIDWSEVPNAIHAWTDPGTFTVNITARNGFGLPVHETHQIEVTNPPPVIEWLEATTSIDIGGTGLFSIDVTDTESHADSLEVGWWIDGEIIPDESRFWLRHTFDVSGPHTVEVRATDSHGGSASSSILIAVGEAAPDAPTLVAENGIIIGENVWLSDQSTLTWSTEGDPGWTVLDAFGLEGDETRYRVDLRHDASGSTYVLQGDIHHLSLMPELGSEMAIACDLIGWSVAMSPDGATVTTSFMTEFGLMEGPIPTTAPFAEKVVRIAIDFEGQHMEFEHTIQAGQALDDPEQAGAGCSRTSTESEWVLSNDWLESNRGSIESLDEPFLETDEAEESGGFLGIALLLVGVVTLLILAVVTMMLVIRRKGGNEAE
jgi:PKD repeat protein